MKIGKLLSVMLILCLLLSACGMVTERHTDYFGFDVADFIMVEEEDTHGGFLGDGSYYLILDCSQNAGKARELTKDWKPLPFTEVLELAMYGGVRGDVMYAYDFAEEAHLPRISNGVYRFHDRHSESKDPSDATDLLNRGSFNFSIAVYDLDTDRLYYFAMDT